jgi:hypothetical protein
MLNTHIARYVSLYRGLGRKFSEQERLLRQYAAFAERFGDRHTRVQRIYDWCHTASSQTWLAIGTTLLVTSAFSLMPRTQTTKSRLSAFSAGGSGHVPLRPSSNRTRCGRSWRRH